MGKFDGKFLRGLVGKVIFRAYRGEQVVQGQSRNANIKRTENSKKASVIFGKSSALGSYIRAALDPVITNFYDGLMTVRFNGELLFSLRTALNKETQDFDFTAASFNRLIGFEFNAKSPLKNTFFAQPTTSTNGNQLQINIPEMRIPQDLKFPQGIKYCKVIVSMALFDLTYGYYKDAIMQTFDVEYLSKDITVPSQQLGFETEPGCLCILAISLQYYEKTFAGNILVNNKSFHPSAILNAFILDGTVDKNQTEKWQVMEFKK